MKLLQINEARDEHIADNMGDMLMSAYSNDDGSKPRITNASELTKYLKDGGEQYLQWISNQYVQGGFKLEELSILRDLLNHYGRMSSTLPDDKKDIMALGSVAELEALVDEKGAEEGDIHKGLNGDTEVEEFYHDGDMGIYIPKTERALCSLASGTKWCNRAGENSGFAQHDGHLYVIQLHSGKKYQLYFNSTSGSVDLISANNESVGITDLLDEHPKLRKVFGKDAKLAGAKEFMSPAQYYEYVSSRDIGSTIRYDKDEAHADRKHLEEFEIVDIGFDYVVAEGSKDKYGSDILLVMEKNTFHIEFRPFTIWVEDYEGNKVTPSQVKRVSQTNKPAVASLVKYMVKSGFMTFMSYWVLERNYLTNKFAVESIIRQFSTVYDEYQRNKPGFGTAQDAKQTKELKRFWEEIPKELKTMDAKAIYHELLKMTGVEHKKLDSEKEEDNKVPEESNRKQKKVKSAYRWDSVN